MANPKPTPTEGAERPRPTVHGAPIVDGKPPKAEKP